MTSTAVTSSMNSVAGGTSSTTPATLVGHRLRFGAAPHTGAAFAKGDARDLVVTWPLSAQQEADLNAYLASRRLP